MDMRFTLRQLEIFVATAQLQTISQAAYSLAMSQSAASSALGELERQYNCQLFDRAGKRLILNKLGTQLLPQAIAVLEHASMLDKELQGQTTLPDLSIGATMTIGNYLATLLIGEFIQQHTSCKINLHVQNSEQIEHLVAQYQLDLALIERLSTNPNIETLPWISDELVVFCAPEHPLAQQKKANLNELLEHTWILREKGSGTRQTFDHAIRHLHQPLHISMELEHTEAIKRAVESGLAISCISRLALRDAFRRGSLVPIETPDLDLKRQFFFIWAKNKYQFSSMRTFINYCLARTKHISASQDFPLPNIA